MRWLSLLLLCLFAVTLAGCSKIKTYNGPEVTEIRVYKEQRQMFLMHNNEVLKRYQFELGFAPEGHKVQERDGRTPEGRYFIDRKNPNSQFHLSIGMSYPNNADRARARAMGVSPGGDIFIHGTPKPVLGNPDWTAGCIAVTNRQMEQIYSMVNVGTPIVVYGATAQTVSIEPTGEQIEPEVVDVPVIDEGNAVVDGVSPIVDGVEM